MTQSKLFIFPRFIFNTFACCQESFTRQQSPRANTNTRQNANNSNEINSESF